MPLATNLHEIVLPSAARTTDQTVDFDLNPLWLPGKLFPRGIVVVTDLTAFVTAASLTVNIQGRDPTSDKTWTILASAAIIAVGTNVLKVGLALPVTANLSSNDPIPPHLRIFADHGNANSHTYSIGLSICP